MFNREDLLTTVCSWMVSTISLKTTLQERPSSNGDHAPRISIRTLRAGAIVETFLWGWHGTLRPFGV
ncbi:hypothetical protein SCLCIDRAFT_339145 [Scleroderma citrinum Foug A]|uniref:Uncharacterized protein n=1 Tax=Scleroderma citrinum Foug A TaxID=1036808 RepID=A0A0C2YZ04_9AGAM|nr:hypothetical protein SCLCIDRAFT_339145 [Scleroderma citrinum Foug A]